MFFIGQKLKYVHGSYSFDDEHLNFFCSTPVDISCLKFDVSLPEGNNSQKYTMQRKQSMK